MHAVAQNRCEIFDYRKILKLLRYNMSPCRALRFCRGYARDMEKRRTILFGWCLDGGGWLVQGWRICCSNVMDARPLLQ